MHHPDIQQAVRQIETPAGGRPHLLVHAVAREQHPQGPLFALELGPERPLRGEHPCRRQHPGGPPADLRGPALPDPHQLRIGAEAEGVEEVPRPAPRPVGPRCEAAQVDLYRVAGGQRPAGVVDLLDPDVVREVVQCATGEDGQRHTVPGRHHGRPVDRAVPAADAQGPAVTGGLLQRGHQLARIALHHFGERQRVPDQGRLGRGRTRRPVDHHDEILAAGQDRCLGVRAAGGGQLVTGRYEPPYREGGTHPERRPDHHVARIVHPGVDAGRGHADGERRDDRAPAPRLQRDARGEGGGRSRVPGGEGRGGRLPLELPHHRYGVQYRSRSADRPLGHRVGDGRRHGQRGHPRSAARRARVERPTAAIPAAAPNHSSPWLALRLSRGSTGPAAGQCRAAAERNRAWSRAPSQPVSRSKRTGPLWGTPDAMETNPLSDRCAPPPAARAADGPVRGLC